MTAEPDRVRLEPVIDIRILYGSFVQIVLIVRGFFGWIVAHDT